MTKRLVFGLLLSSMAAMAQAIEVAPTAQVQLKIDGASVRHTMAGGFGASWHAIQQPIVVEGDRSHGGHEIRN